MGNPYTKKFRKSYQILNKKLLKISKDDLKIIKKWEKSSPQILVSDLPFKKYNRLDKRCVWSTKKYM